MVDVKFALPTVPHSDMPTSGQHSLVSQQVTAVIVAAYLEHTTVVFQTYEAAGRDAAAWTVDRDEIGPLINQVQRALKYTGD